MRKGGRWRGAKRKGTLEATEKFRCEEREIKRVNHVLEEAMKKR